MKKGGIITFEGIDQSGKETQSRLIRERLEREGYRVGYTFFPHYETNIGREIRKFLDGTVPYASDVVQLLYAANRYEMSAFIEKLQAENDYVIIDRYISSGVVYGKVNGLDQDWMEAVEAKLPQEDMTVLLDISSEVSRSRKKEARDLYEQKYGFLDRVRAAYLDMAEKNHWIVIDAAGSIEEVQRLVWSALEERLHIPSNDASSRDTDDLL